ncbi:hypothetical protein [Kutzneria sp. CA-103260]|uniref:hypothetical protein n=1 Tax=Kutzneria sp. CA-103260 TaxID=2802641 RepID=UPI001BA9B0D5|nr:hypothetical protein [Kutzneria sp. CA-103260]QUQ64602.1 hypothetical protein JJ691_23220 [Kutzneria sp. CA-103260]
MDTASDMAWELASAAAKRLIDLLATDGWTAIKASVLSLWKHSHPERVEAELAEARGELMQATQAGDSVELQGLLVAEWQARLARLIATRPDITDQLRALLLQVPPDMGSTGQQTTASMTLEAQVSGGGDAYLAGRDLTITQGEAG